MPEPSCCSSPEPELKGLPMTQDGRRDRIDCMDPENRNGTLLDVLGIDPPW